MMIELRVLWLVGFLTVTIGMTLLIRAGVAAAERLRPARQRMRMHTRPIGRQTSAQVRS
jgi:hypothetical protein